MRTPASAQQGMTLLEILIATMLLGVVAIVVFTAFGVGLRAASLARGMNTAVSLAEETLTTLTASPCGTSFHAPVAPQIEDPRLAAYRRDAIVQRAPGRNLWELGVTVTWTQERMQRSVTLTTLRHISAACEFVGQ